MKHNQYANQYAQIDIESAIHNASAHQVIALLMQGFLTSVNTAKAAINNKDYAVKSKQINKARDIIWGLEDGLNLEAGGDLGQNLQQLYQYISNRLLQATAKNSIEMLDEVAHLMREIKEAWDAIPEKLESTV